MKNISEKLFLLFILSVIVGSFVLILVNQPKAEATYGHHDGPYPHVTPTKTPTPTPTVDPCHVYVHRWVDKKQEFEDEDTPPCITPSPEATPSPEVKVDAGSDGRHSEAPPMPQVGDRVCRGEVPPPAYNLSGKRIDAYSVVLSWTVSGVSHDNQVLLYGRTPDNLEYGIPELPGNSSEITINGANWGSVYFKIGTWKGDCISWSMVGDP